MLSLERLAAFDDKSSLRDPRGRAAAPSLLPARGDTLEVRGPFQVRRTIHPAKERGVGFARATGDANPIHTDGEVLPGAFTAAQFVAPLEILIPRLALESLRVSFTAVAWYGRTLRTTMLVTPKDDHVAVVAQAFQGDRLVATGEGVGKILPAPTRIEVPAKKVDRAWQARVEQFLRALGIEPRAYFEKPEGPDASYPYSFVTSLPSGTMVERLSGQGGILNRLTLDFDPGKLPIAGPPEVSLELPARLRASFNKIITLVKEGVLTAARGAALVLPRSSAPEDLTHPPSL
jgi:acyl dehydratase